MAMQLQALAFCSGVVSHILLFCRSEWDRHSPKIFLAHAILVILTFATFVLATEYSVTRCFAETISVNSALISGIFSSMIVYRLIFHPLRLFPGPFLARVSSFWAIRGQWPDLNLYVKLQDIHTKYGDFVRISKFASPHLDTDY